MRRPSKKSFWGMISIFVLAFVVSIWAAVKYGKPNSKPTKGFNIIQVWNGHGFTPIFIPRD